MNIYLAADHGGFEMKEHLKKWLAEHGYAFEDCGAFQLDPEDDYPDFSFAAAQKVAADTTDQALAVLACRSSGGAVIAANKVRGIRAVSVFDEISAKHAREHNNANVIGISGDWSTSQEVEKIVEAFLTTSFSAGGAGVRHQRRIEKITAYEKTHI